MKNNIFWKNFFRLTSEISAKLFVTIGKIFTEKLSKLFSTCSGKNWRNSFFKKFLFFMYIRTSSETFLDFWEFLFANSSKLLFTSSNELFDGTEFCENFLSFLYRVVIKIFSDLRKNMYQKIAWTDFYVFRKHFEETDFSESFFRVRYILGLWTKSFLNFGTNVSVKMSKLLPTRPDEHFHGKQFFLNTFFIPWTLVDAFFWLMTILSLQNFQKCFLRLQGNTLIKKNFLKNTSSFFPDREQFISWFAAKTLRRSCPNCFVRVQKTFSRCGLFQLFCFWRKFGFWANFFLTCGTNFSVKLSKLLSPYSDDYYDRKHFFGKFFNLSSDFERNIFWTWVKFSQKSSQKRILRVQKSFWRNWLFGEIFDQYVY